MKQDGKSKMVKDNQRSDNFHDRRKKKRISVLEELDIPINIQFQDTEEEIEGVLVNLSASGIGLICFSVFPQGKKVNLSLKLDHLEVENLEGDIVWKSKEENVCRMGIKFVQIDSRLAKSIDQITEEYRACELRAVQDKEQSCFPGCKYTFFCKKKKRFTREKSAS